MSYYLTNGQVEVLRNFVREGAELLDHKYPKWETAISLAHLDLGDPQFCVAGQLASIQIDNVKWDDWNHLLDEGLEVEPHLYGFDTYFDWEDINPDNLNDATTEEYAALTEAWREEIKARTNE